MLNKTFSNDTSCFYPPRIAICSDKGVLLPLLDEYTWPEVPRTIAYLFGLLWSFLAVSIIADIFMQSIEMITSKTRTIKAADPVNKGEYIDYEVKVWNDTVANLTLMALGSSAPEILLSIAEIVLKNRFKAGDLGPGTIVGSAAFNMLVIIAVCIVSIPENEGRTIKSIKVFAVTAFFSIFAYVWLIVILIGHTEGVVDVSEALVTLALFPILVLVAFATDKEIFQRKKRVVDDSKTRGIALGPIDVESSDSVQIIAMKETIDMQNIIKKIMSRPSLKKKDVAMITARYVSDTQPRSRAWYRINALRTIAGAQKLVPTLTPSQNKLLKRIEDGDMLDSQTSIDQMSVGGTLAVIDFAAPAQAVSENCGHVKIGINRTGKLNNRVIFRIETVDGTAVAEEDYIPLKQTMIFEPNESHLTVDIEIVDDNQWEPDEVFFVRITVDLEQMAKVGDQGICQVTILNDDDPGCLEFDGPSFLYKESVGRAHIPVHRRNGVDGKISVKWLTEDMTAKEGSDFLGREGVLQFEHGEEVKNIEITIINNHDQETGGDENFNLTLSETTGGATLGQLIKTVVTIVSDNEFSGLLSRVTNLTRKNLDAVSIHRTTWRDQFRQAMCPNGGEIESATHLDYVMHFFTFIWKILFAIVPPVSIFGGWLAFFCALAMIAFVTVIIGDLASIFGCLIGLHDSVTAITFVALGTSLPDLFASKQAATNENTADNSIGNVTGSNSVNVFLGLGLPWTIAAIYWKVQGRQFDVDAGTLGFSVILYTTCASLCIILLLCRRYLPIFGRSELGGKTLPKIISAVFLCILWLGYVLISSLQVYKHIKVNI